MASMRAVTRALTRVWKGSLGFLAAILAVVATLTLWLLIFRSAYWVAHGVRAGRPIDYVGLDYLLLVASLAVAVWPVFRFANPPEDIS